MTDDFNKKMLKEFDYYSCKKNSRKSARILDKFPVTYKPISHPDMEEIKKNYALFPTSERRPQSKPADKKENGPGDDEFEAICADLSGFGVRIITEKILSPGDFIELTIAPPVGTRQFIVQSVGKVMRVSSVGTDGPPSYYAGVSFFAIHENDREEITHYTFEIQQRLLQLKRRIRDDTAD